MPEPISAIRELGGVAFIGQLRDLGIGDRLVRGLWRAGKIERVRRGWYATFDANQLVVQAARVGGSLACVSGLAGRGVWQPPGSTLHVSVPIRSRHVKHPVLGTPIRSSITSVEIHWNGRHGASTSFRPGLLPVMECLVEVLHCQPENMAFAVVESALRQGLLSNAQLGALARRVPSRARMLRFAGPLSDSGTESLFRFGMRESRMQIRQQVEIPGVGRVDFLIGDRLIVEIDSEAHHGSREQRRRDLERDAVAAMHDFEVLRFDYAPVISDWDFVASAVGAVVERRGHLRA